MSQFQGWPTVPRPVATVQLVISGGGGAEAVFPVCLSPGLLSSDSSSIALGLLPRFSVWARGAGS